MGTFWFSEALGSAEPEAFLKRRGFLCHKKPHKKSQEIWENVVRNAKNRPWNATRQLFSGEGGWACIKFGPVVFRINFDQNNLHLHFSRNFSLTLLKFPRRAFKSAFFPPQGRSLCSSCPCCVRQTSGIYKTYTYTPKIPRIYYAWNLCLTLTLAGLHF